MKQTLDECQTRARQLADVAIEGNTHLDEAERALATALELVRGLREECRWADWADYLEKHPASLRSEPSIPKFQSASAPQVDTQAPDSPCGSLPDH
jgi:hypothetical protein